MTIEVALLISVGSFLFSIFLGITNMKRSQKLDAENDASQTTTIIVKLENINNGITEIKAELTSVRADIRENRERIIKLEEKNKQLEHLITSSPH